MAYNQSMADGGARSPVQPIVWIGDSLEMVRSFPDMVRQEVGFALYQAQRGAKHINAKPLKGLGTGVLEVTSDYRGDTFRAVYTVRLAGCVYVLHAFQKKSRKGIETSRSDIELIRQRLRRATELHALRG